MARAAQFLTQTGSARGCQAVVAGGTLVLLANGSTWVPAAVGAGLVGYSLWVLRRTRTLPTNLQADEARSIRYRP